MATVKSTDQTKNQAVTFLNSFLDEFQHWCNEPTAPSAIDLEQFLAPNFKISSNGKVLSQSLNDYLARIGNFRKKYASVEITNVQDPLVDGNKMAVQYEIYMITHTGQKTLVYISALATIENNKLNEWSQVAFEQGEGQWDA